MTRFAFAGTLIVLMAFVSPARAAAPRLTFCSRPDNDLYATLRHSGLTLPRYDTPADAVGDAEEGSAVLILADAYPEQRTAVDSKVLARVKEKKLRLYVEYPDAIPDLTFAEPRKTQWERLVVASDGLGDALPKLRILMAHECRFLPVEGVKAPLVVAARVAGYDTAVYGLPEQAWPVLFEAPGQPNLLVATTKLSHFVTGRYAPAAEWKALWQQILARLDPQAALIDLKWEPIVAASHAAGAPITPEAERAAFARAAAWYPNSRLLVTSDREPAIHQNLLTNVEAAPLPPADAPVGDGSRGILEGYASGIQADGSQLQRQPIRFDCQVESAMVLALDAALNDNASHGKIATNLLDYGYFASDMFRNGQRGDPRHPSYGLIAWGTVSPAWAVGNYGDDNARSLLATILAAAALKSDRWDGSVLTSLHANLRTTGRLGFRGDRVDQPQLEQLGWRHFHDAETTNLAPHFEAYLWACYLWAYQQTGERAFLDKTKTAVRLTMEAYAKGQWRWNDNIERARMLLPLAWLVRVEDTPEHRGWAKTVARDLIAAQVECGAIQERLAGAGGGHYVIPQSNEAYGVGETPLVQRTGDPVSDQLYTTGFALLALREAAAAMDDASLREAEDRLAHYLCRIQTRSEQRPELDGTWFRAFDYERWECWASSADIGWGAWSIEAGWAQSWTAAVLALRQRQTTFWDFTKDSTVERHAESVREKMALNDGGPHRK